jgi:hypothetical protein
MSGDDIPGPLQRRADDFGHIDQLESQFDRAGFETRHVEEIGDEPVQALGFFLQGAEQLFAFGRTVLLREAAQARYGAEDRGERRSQIV